MHEPISSYSFNSYLYIDPSRFLAVNILLTQFPTLDHSHPHPSYSIPASLFLFFDESHALELVAL